MILREDNEEEIKALLVGRTVTKVTDSTLTLDNGTLLKLEGNYGCGGCPSGNYYLTELNDCPNMVMNVEFEEEKLNDDYDPQMAYRIFVYAENKKIKLAEFEGTDGNGYYGTGYWIQVSSQ